MSESHFDKQELERLRRRVSELEAQVAASGPGAAFHGLFDAMFEGVQIIDFECRYVYLNETAARQGRQAREDLLGRRMDERYPGIEQSEFWKLLGRCLRERSHQQLLNHFSYPDGSRGWFDLRINPVPEGALIFSFDISAQKALEEELARSRENLDKTLQCIGETVVATDRDGRITLLNRRGEAVTGWTQAEALGRPLESVIRLTEEGSEEPLALVQRILSEGLRTGMVNHKRLFDRAGAEHPAAVSGAPVRDAAGAVSGAVLVIRDLSDEHEMAQRLRQAERLESVGRLAGGVAHDFNNLITVINGYADLVLAGLPADGPHAELEHIRQAGTRAADLTRQLLAFSRRQVLQPRVLDLNEAVAGVARMLRRVIAENIDLQVRCAPRLDRVRFDPGQLEQVLMNLALNARDAMPEGGRLTLETANVVLDEAYVKLHPEAQAGPHVLLAVTDTGVGMDPSVQARIFEPFFTTKAQGRGTGLGLATVYGIVKQGGGNIWIYSEPGQGACFKVYLPAVREEAERPAPPPPAAPGKPGGTLLLVEDDESVRRLLLTVLEGGGYRVQAAGSAEAALDLLRGGARFDLLLTDVVLPGMNGRRLHEEALRLCPGLRTVFMSGYTDNAIVHQGVLDPGMAFIEKPVSPQVLLRKLQEFLLRPPA